MAKRSNRPVSIKVHRDFFDRIFEPERRSLENRIGTKVTQSDFTKFLANSNVKFKYNPNNFGLPIKKRRGRGFSIL